MKKIFIILICILLIKPVFAENNIKYKWYIEKETESLYYPKKEPLDEYIEDPNNIEYSDYSSWSNEYCNYPKEYYSIEEKTTYTYKKLEQIKYIMINPQSYYNCPDISCFNTIKVYSENNEIEYTILQNDNNGIKLELTNEYDPYNLWLYIDTNVRYVVYFSVNNEMNRIILGYFVRPTFDGNILFPNENWLLTQSEYVEIITQTKPPSESNIKELKENTVCRVREINTYRYKKAKVYYDNNYHKYVDGYIPDINDYLYEETENNNKCHSETNLNNNNILKDDAYEKEITTNNNSMIRTIYKTKIKEKIVYKNNPKIQVVIIISIMLIIMGLIIVKKCRLKHLSSIVENVSKKNNIC